MKSKGILRILEVGHDPWIAPDFETDFLPIGGSLAPGNSAAQALRTVSWKIFWRLLSRSYDVIALPPIHIHRVLGLGCKAKLAKKLFGLIAGSGLLAGALRRLIAGRKTIIVIFDIDDAVEVSEEASHVFQPRIYFKRNLLREDLLRDSSRLCQLPMGVSEWGGANSAPATDAFVCGEYSTEARKLSLEAAKRLQCLGWRVDIIEARIPYSEYRQRLAQAKTAFCFQGVGFHTWRMYEAACSGTIPIIDTPSGDLIHDFVDGENCIIVPPSLEQIVLSVDNLLRSPERLEKIGIRVRRLAESKYTRQACSQFLFWEIARRYV
jgi:glycosyltransferase involved in cell wall biosynthesis